MIHYEENRLFSSDNIHGSHQKQIFQLASDQVARYLKKQTE